MGFSRQPEPTWEYFETGSEPEYFVTHTRLEVVQGGNIRIYCYVKRHDRMHLLYTAIVPPSDLAEMARKSMQVAAEAHNSSLWSGAEH